MTDKVTEWTEWLIANFYSISHEIAFLCSYMNWYHKCNGFRNVYCVFENKLLSLSRLNSFKLHSRNFLIDWSLPYGQFLLCHRIIYKLSVCLCFLLFSWNIINKVKLCLITFCLIYLCASFTVSSFWILRDPSKKKFSAF